MAVGREQSRSLSITVSSATGTGSPTPIWAVARWIRVIPVSETDTYDVTFKDGEGDIMGKYTSQSGTLSQRLEMSLGILKTVLIENASQDGTYRIKFDFH